MIALAINSGISVTAWMAEEPRVLDTALAMLDEARKQK